MIRITNDLRAALGAATAHRVARGGARDLAFDGWRLGTAETGDNQYRCDWTRWTTVTIWLTTGGRLVAQVARHSRWQGESASSEATVHTDASSLLAALTVDGRLGRASKTAWEEACDACPALSGQEVENVE